MANLLQTPPARSLSRNPIVYIVRSAAASDVEQVDLEIRIRQSGAATYDDVVTLNMCFDSQEQAYTDIASIVHAEIDRRRFDIAAQILRNSTLGTEPFVAENSYDVQVGMIEVRNNVRTEAETHDITVMYGGVDMLKHVDCNFFDTLDATNSILSQQPDRRTMKYGQPQWLSWYNHTGADQDVVLELENYGTASAAGLGTFLMLPLTVPAGEVGVFPVGYAQLSQAMPPAVVKTTMRVIDATNTLNKLSETVTYYIDCSSERCLDYLLYENSYGLPEILTATGRKAKDLQISRISSRRTILDSYKSYDRQQDQFDVDWQNPLTYRSGYITREELDALQEMLIYNRVWEHKTESIFDAPISPPPPIGSGLYLYALYITGTRFSIDECLQFLHSVDIPVVRSIRPVSYTNSEIPCSQSTTVVTDCTDAWQDINDDCWLTVESYKWNVA